MPIDPATLVAPVGTRPLEWQTRAPAGFNAHKPAPIDSPDLRRVLALPRRDVIEGVAGKRDDGSEILTDLGKVYVGWAQKTLGVQRPPPCACPQIVKKYGRPPRGCIDTPRFVQALALYELAKVGGLVAGIGVGYGKTTILLLSPLVWRGVRKVLGLVQPGDLEQLVMTYEMLAQHFRVPSLIVHAQIATLPDLQPMIVPGAPQLHILPYSKLSRPESSAFIRQLAPDAIIADEADKLRDTTTATGARFVRRFTEAPETRAAFMTGSLTEASILDYWLFALLALRERSPLPIDQQVAQEWALAIDPDPCPADPGALLALCRPGEHIHSAYHRRLSETEGVILTTEPAVDCRVEINERKLMVPIPREVQDALRSVRNFVRPDGEELVEVFEMLRCAREVACGFYYEWWYPRGEPRELINRWFDARKAWNKAVRCKIAENVEHLDSPKLAENAAKRAYGELAPGVCKSSGAPLPVWQAPEWPAWRDVRDLVKPKSRGVRLHPYLAEDAAQWATTNRGIVWYADREFGAWVAELSGLPQHVGGPKAAALIGRERGDRSILASMKAHGRGRDGLQRIFDLNLIANPPANATGWEQLLGRTVRTGQSSDVVRAWFYRHTIELRKHVDQALERAQYVQATMGTRQKLLAGLGDLDDDFSLDG